MIGSQNYFNSRSIPGRSTFGRANNWPPFAVPSAAVRRHLKPAPLTWPAMATLLCLLLAVAVAFGITALHQREGYKDAVRQAALLSQHNAELSRRIAQADSLADGLDERLLELALSAFRDGAEDVVSGLQELQGRHPHLARSDAFAQLWRSAHDAAALQTQFETATGGDLQVREMDFSAAPGLEKQASSDQASTD